MDYYDRPELSNSMIGRFLECPAEAMSGAAWAETEPMLVGSYVDCRLLEPAKFGAFEEKHEKRIFKGKGDKRELRAGFVKADAMVDRVKHDPVMMEYLAGDCQMEVFAEIQGVPVKG